MQQPLSVCSSLKGRNSDYITPHNIPLNVTIDNRSLDFTNVLLQNLLHHTNTLQICYELYKYLLCLVALPPCNNSTSAPLLLCPETCRAYENLLSIGACDSYSIAIVEVQNASIESRKLIPFLTATILQVTSTMVSLSPRTHAQTYLGQKAKVKLYGYNCFLKSLCVSAEILLDKKTLFR